MKLLRLTFAIFFIITLIVTHAVKANVCGESEEHAFLLCGNWTDPEVEEVLSSLIGDEEIHKLIKQSEDYYLLHTCEERTKKNVCMRGLVYVIERDDGILVVRPEMWDWVF